MRALLAKDIAPFTKILAKMELKDIIKAVFTKKDDATDKEAKEGEMVSTLLSGILENYHKAEGEFFSFIANLEGKTAEDIARMPLPEFIQILTELFSEKNLPFLKSVSK